MIKTLTGNYFSNKTDYGGSEADLKAMILSLALKVHLVSCDNMFAL